MTRTHDGRAVKILTIIDEHTRECLSLDVERRITKEQALERLADLFARRGVPKYIRSDNGPEFRAKAVRDWLKDLGVTTLYIEPGSPWENGCVGSFHGRMRDELLNGEVFMESAPGYSFEVWTIDTGADNDPWGDTMSDLSQLGLTAVLSAVDPWAAVAGLGLNLLGSNPTAAAFVDFVVPEDVRANRYRIDITGQPVAAGWKTKGSEAKDSNVQGGWGDLKIGDICGWVIFDGALLKKMPDETLRQITNCEVAATQETEAVDDEETDLEPILEPILANAPPE